MELLEESNMEHNEVFICECNSPEHQAIFTWYDLEGLKAVYMEVHLKPFGFWTRLKHAIKYVFGHRSNYGDFDEFIFKPTDVDKLEKIVEYLKK